MKNLFQLPPCDAPMSDFLLFVMGEWQVYRATLYAAYSQTTDLMVAEEINRRILETDRHIDCLRNRAFPLVSVQS